MEVRDEAGFAENWRGEIDIPFARCRYGIEFWAASCLDRLLGVPSDVSRLREMSSDELSYTYFGKGMLIHKAD